MTFKDIAGIDQVKSEIMEIVEFLRNPQRFLALGARSPAGVLLVGPPGEHAPHDGRPLIIPCCAVLAVLWLHLGVRHACGVELACNAVVAEGPCCCSPELGGWGEKAV